jgi:hypothetical protein
MHVIGGFLMACASSDVDQVCRPELQAGCPEGLFCTITQAGVSVCLDAELGRLSEGMACESFESQADALTQPLGVCGQGTACIQDGGVTRCLRLCNAAADVVTSCQAPQEGETRHEYAALSRCTMRVADRPEIGVCRLPCKFGGSGEDAGCPAGTSCGVLADDRRAQCLSDGEVTISGACGPNCMCSSGLVCVPDAEGASCRVAITSSGCGDTHFLGQVEGSVDQLDTSNDPQPYTYCTRCVPFIIGAEQKIVWLCAGEQGCEGTKTLANLNSIDLSQVAARVASKLGDVFQVVVGLEFRDNEWYWANASVPQPTMSQGDNGRCPTMDAQGNLVIAAGCPGFSLCEAPMLVQCGFSVDD